MKRSTASENKFIQEFEKMQTDLGKDFQDIQDKIKALENKLTQKKYDKAFNNGYLRSPLTDYFDCLKLKAGTFAELMDKDLAEWREIKEKKKREFEEEL